MIKSNKTEYIEGILKEAQHATNSNLSGELWKAINRISKFRSKNNTALKTNKGEWCTSVEEELNTIKEHLQKDYNTTDQPNIGTEVNLTELQEINWIHYRGALNRVKVNKAVPSWAAPTATYHITSDIISQHLTQAIHTTLKTKTYPQIWMDIQTVWIEKNRQRLITDRKPKANKPRRTRVQSIFKHTTGTTGRRTNNKVASYHNWINSVQIYNRLDNVSHYINTKTNKKQTVLPPHIQRLHESIRQHGLIKASKNTKGKTIKQYRTIRTVNPKIKQRRLCNRTKRPNYNTTHETRSPTRMPSEPSDFQHRHARNKARIEHKKKKFIRANG